MSESPTSSTALLTMVEAAEMLGISESHLRRNIINRKRIPVVRIGRRVFIRRDHAEQYIEAHTVEAEEG